MYTVILQLQNYSRRSPAAHIFSFLLQFGHLQQIFRDE